MTTPAEDAVSGICLLLDDASRYAAATDDDRLFSQLKVIDEDLAMAADTLSASGAYTRLQKYKHYEDAKKAESRLRANVLSDIEIGRRDLTETTLAPFYDKVEDLFSEKGASAKQRKLADEMSKVPATISHEDLDTLIMSLTVSKDPEFLASLKKLKDVVTKLLEVEYSAQSATNKVVQDATWYFQNIEKDLDAHAKKLKDLERKYPDIGGHDFDDLVRWVEDLSDDVSGMPESL